MNAVKEVYVHADTLSQGDFLVRTQTDLTDSTVQENAEKMLEFSVK